MTAAVISLGADSTLTGAGDVGRAHARGKHLTDRRFDPVGQRALVERVAQHHAGREDRRQRVGHALSGDVGRRAVHGFEQTLAGGVERGRRQHPDRAGQHGCEVGQDVTEHVGGDEDIELLGRAHELHRGIVDIHVRQLDIGIFRCEAVDQFAPQLADLEHVGLVDRTQAPAALTRDLEA